MSSFTYYGTDATGKILETLVGTIEVKGFPRSNFYPGYLRVCCHWLSYMKLGAEEHEHLPDGGHAHHVLVKDVDVELVL